MLFKDIYRRALKNIKFNKLGYFLILISISVSTVSLFFLYSFGFNVKNDITKTFYNDINLFKMTVNYTGEEISLNENREKRIEILEKIDGIKEVLDDEVTMEVVIEDESKIDQITSEIKENGFVIFSSYEAMKDTMKILELINRVLLVLGSISFLMALINISNSIKVSLNERKYEIGVMRAVGIGMKDLRFIIFLENFLVAISGVGIGIFCKVLTSPIIDKIFSSNIPYSFCQVESISKLSFMRMFIIIAFILLIVTLVIWNALRKIKKLDLIEVIKGE